MKKTILLTILSLLLVHCRADRPASLKEAYKEAFIIGAALNNAIVSGRDTSGQTIVRRQFNTITPENVMKPGPINPRPGVYKFDAADAYVTFGEDNGMFIVGHTLVWHNQTPDWFFEEENGIPKTREAQIERLRGHIKSVAGRYAGRVQAWDVVNEVVNEDGSYRPTKWVKNIGSGDDLVKLAFRFAGEFAPEAELYYNDYNAWRPSKRDGIIRLVGMLQEAGIRIDGVGMQAHWGLDRPNTADIETAIDMYAELGVKVMITELDIDVLPSGGEDRRQNQSDASLNPYTAGLPDSVQQKLTERYVELFGLFYRKRNMIDRITFWGVHDGMSWKNNFPIRGRTNYPLLFDRDRQPKPAFKALLELPFTIK